MGLIRSVGAAGGRLVLLGGLLLPAPALRAEVLYRLDTFCSVDGADAVPCRLEAVNGSGFTEYRQRLTDREVRFRVIDEPVTRVELLDAASGRWSSVRRAAALFDLNAVCLDGVRFCVLNPNYLNSVRQQLGAAASGRKVLELQFGDDGRVDAGCYDAGCPDGGRLLPER